MTVAGVSMSSPTTSARTSAKWQATKWPSRLVSNSGISTRQLAREAGQNHYLQFVEACRGNGTTSAPFSYSGPLTESVLLGCLATRFPKTTLQWDAAQLKVTNEEKANQFVRKTYRKGWEVEGL